MAAHRIGYLTCVETMGRYVGALMVTDGAGIPLEFKYTEPIKPTRIQAILYGGALERYIKLEVIRTKLVKALQNRPEVIFVDNTDLSLLGASEGIPVVALQRARIPPLGGAGEVKRPKENELIAQTQEGADPLRLIFEGMQQEVIERIAGLVIDAGRAADLAEPLERLEKAIEALMKEGQAKENG
jgi:hypothetical protein